ncbi:MAG TPA: cyclic nucleotide-binding domain-containing protein [Terracidiphilus sp.]|nr:cyclic nucleotide-binding domain-containing protein [Terracidiphilus sp.]
MKLDSTAFLADHELVEALETRSTPVFCDTDRILFTQGEEPEGLFILQSGTATLSMTTPQGEEIMCIPIAAGSVLGLPGLIGNQPYSLTAIGMQGSTLRFVSREDFSHIIAEKPSLSMSVLRVLAAEVRTARFAITAI